MKSEYKEIPAIMRSNITPLSDDYFSLLFFFIQKFLFVAPKFKWKLLSEIMNCQQKFWEDVRHVCTISNEFSVIWCVLLTNQNFSMPLKPFWRQIQIKKWSKFWTIMFPMNMQTRHCEPFWIKKPKKKNFFSFLGSLNANTYKNFDHL